MSIVIGYFIAKKLRTVYIYKVEPKTIYNFVPPHSTTVNPFLWKSLND